MRSGFSVLAVAAAVMAADAGFTPSAAQSFFQKLFGGGEPEATPAASRPVPSLKSFGRVSPYGGTVTRSAPDEQNQSQSSGGSYRTLCVRTCDGYYWPISSSASQSRLHQDARRCESSCDTEAKMFYLPRGSSDIANMTDLSGRSYGRLPTAFAYRTSLMAGCSCRPMPWNQSEKLRHEGYRVVATLERERLAAATAPAPAETDSKTPAKDKTVKSEKPEQAPPPAPVAVAENTFDPPMAADMPVEWAPGSSRRFGGPPQHENGPAAAAEASEPVEPAPAVEASSEMVVTSAEAIPAETATLMASPDAPALADTPVNAEPVSAETAASSDPEPAQHVEATEPEVVALATVAPWQPAFASRMAAPVAAAAQATSPEPAPSIGTQMPVAVGVATPDQPAAEPLELAAVAVPPTPDRTNPPALANSKTVAKKPARPATSSRTKPKPSKATAVASWMGTGGGKYTWPGDAPQRRVR